MRRPISKRAPGRCDLTLNLLGRSTFFRFPTHTYIPAGRWLPIATTTTTTAATNHAHNNRHTSMYARAANHRGCHRAQQKDHCRHRRRDIDERWNPRKLPGLFLKFCLGRLWNGCLGRAAANPVLLLLSRTSDRKTDCIIWSRSSILAM